MLLGVLLAVIGGLLLGSFGTVVVYRVPRKESIVRPGSRCPSCATPVRPADNVPVVSWVLLRGRCRSCRAPIPVRYPLIEALTATLFGLGAALLEPTDLIAFLPLFWLLVVLSFIDLELKILPNRLVLPAIAVGVVLLAVAAALGPGMGAWVRALVGGAVGFTFFLVLALVAPAGMGMGDVKLAALLGLSLGYFSIPRLIVGFFLSFALGAAGGLALIAAGRGGRKTQVPFGPYLALGTVIAVLWGRGLAERFFTL